MNGAREDAHAGGHSAVHGAPGGLAVSAAGYTLQVSPKMFEAGREEAFERLAGALVASPAALLSLGWRPPVQTEEGLRALARSSAPAS